MTQRTILYKEIKRGGMQCTVEQDSDGVFVRIKYKDQVRNFGPFADEDAAAMELQKAADIWIEEIVSKHRATPNLRK